MKNKTISESKVIMTEIVLPNDTNPLGILLGGRLLYWMDIAAAICAQNHAEKLAVTASIDSVVFKDSIRIGNVVYIEALLSRAFNSSMEVYVEVYKKDIKSRKKKKTNHAYFTFVALNDEGVPSPVKPITFDNTPHKLLYIGAMERKIKRLAAKN